MTLDPILGSSPLIQIHTLAACLAFLLGPMVILRKRRDRVHRIMGIVWVGAMLVTAVTALGIFELRIIGPFSPIHALSALVGLMLWRGVRAIRAGRVVAHGRIMAQLYIWSLGIAGLFTLLPGRRMHAVMMGDTGWTGFALAAVAFAIGACVLWSAQPREAGAKRAHFSPFQPQPDSLEAKSHGVRSWRNW